MDYTEDAGSAIAAAIREAERIEELLGGPDVGPASHIGMAAIEGAHGAVVEVVEAADPAYVDAVVEEFEGTARKVDELMELRGRLQELDLSTTEVDQRIADLGRTEAHDDSVLIGRYLSTRGLPKGRGGGQPLSIGQPESAPTLEDEEDLGETPLMLIKLGTDAGELSHVQIGRRKIRLTGARHEQEKDYRAERFSALVVLTELLEGQEMQVAELWDKMHTDVLGKESAPDFDGDTMRRVREFITELRYRQQPIFHHNGLRGFSSGYGINPALKYDVAMDADDQAVRLFARGLLEQPVAVSAEELLPDKDEALQPVEKTEIVMPSALPSVFELHTFLAKVQSTLPQVSRQIQFDDSSMFPRLYELAEETLELLEESCAADQKRDLNEGLESARNEAVEKFIRMTEDYNLLNELLANDEEGLLIAAYGEATAPQVISLVETILDMDDQEKDYLRKIICGQPLIQVTVDEGSFSRGQQVMSVVTGLSSLPDIIDDETSVGAIITVEEDVEVEPPIVEVMPVLSEGEEASTIDEVSSTEEDQEEVVVALDRSRPSPSRAKFIRQTVGETVQKVLGHNVRPGMILKPGQVEAIFGIDLARIIDAKESNLIGQRNADLGFEDIVILLANQDAKTKHLLQVPGHRKAFRKRVRAVSKSAELVS